VALSFASEAEQEALASSLPEAARVDVHRAVLAELRREGDRIPDDRAAAVAYHAARAGARELALDQLEALAASSRTRLAHLETARWLTQALELAGDAPSARRRRLLTERGRARRMLTQYEQAATDLREARALAEAEGDTAAIVDILVIETACADFTEQLGEAVRAIERARELAQARGAGRDGAGSELPASIRARLCNWLGVVRARQERLSEARTELEQAIELAGAIGEHDTEIGSMLMLGGVMRRLGLVDEGRAVLDRVIELCERTGDHFHLAAAHFNRINVWRRLGEPARAEADAERAIAIANRMGIDQLELWGWYNLSELRWWTGSLDGALAAAEASHRIGVERFRARPPVIGALWYALLLGAAGEVAAATRILDEVRADEVGHNPWLALVRDVAALVCAGELGDAWEPLVARAARPGAEEDAVMVHWARARTAARAGDMGLAARATADASAAAAALGRAAPT
jgi:tetratricopeptide (TPR) repeat protein